MSLITRYIEDLRQRAAQGDEEARRALEEAELLEGDAGAMSIDKLWLDNRRELTTSERLVRATMHLQGGGNAEEVINYAAVCLHTLEAERERLSKLIRAQRLEIQQLQFPELNAPECRVGADQIAQRIYDVAARAVELMQREGMEGDYEVTFNSLAEIASYGQPLCGVSTE